MKYMSTIRAAVLALAVGALAGCASPYGPQALTGGFKEQKLAANSYRISYNGNGYTPEEQVVLYWLHRCAELTVQNGYSYFGMVPGSERAAVDPGADIPQMLNVKGGGGGHYIYVPSYSTYTIRTWHKHGTIVMYHSRLAALTPEQAHALHAQTVLDRLGEYVKSGAKVKAPPRQEVIEAAMRYTPALGGGAVQELPQTTVGPAR